jgi:large repetitive protein
MLNPRPRTARTSSAKRITALTAAIISASGGIFLAGMTPAAAVDPTCNATPAVGETVFCTVSTTIAVPTGATSVIMKAIGGGGGAGRFNTAGAGGNGAEVSGALSTLSGADHLRLTVGAGGAGAAGVGQAGQGGTGSGVFAVTGTTYTTLMVAGGGAGGGGNDDTPAGTSGAGGDGGHRAPSTAPGGTAYAADDGETANVTAQDYGLGGGAGATNTIGAGGIGTATSGGNSHNGNAGTAAPSTPDGTIAAGGAGGTDGTSPLGGSGGGGFNGGGGGSAAEDGTNFNGAGGGGGSSYLKTGVTDSSLMSAATTADGYGDGAAAQASTTTATSGQPGMVQVTFQAAPPTVTSITGGNGNATVAFTAPTVGGSATISGYQYRLATGGSDNNWHTLTTTGTAPNLTGTISSLTNYVEYGVQIRAVVDFNSTSYNGAATSPQSVTPNKGPAAPTTLTATAGDQSATLSFTVPSDFGTPVDRYDYLQNGNPSDPDSNWLSFTPSGSGNTRTYTVTGLTNGTAYTFYVRAHNAKGNGPASGSASTTAATVPGAPTQAALTVGNGQLTVNKTAPASDGGSAISGYQYSTDTGATWVALPNDNIITGLTNGTPVTVLVRAVNGAGYSAASNAQTATPATTAGAPTITALNPSDGKLTVVYTAPTDDGGSAITGYQYTIDTGATWVALPTDKTITGLTNGSQVSVAIRAVNGAGNGASSASVAGTASAPPAAPTGTSVTPGDHQVTVFFTAPTNTGGSAIDGFQYQLSPGGDWSHLTLNNSAQPPYTGGLSGTITGLTNGNTFQISVRALNSAGPGTATAAITATPKGVSAAPGLIQVAPSDHTLTLSLTPPGDTGGAAITGYQYSTDNGTSWSALTTTPSPAPTTGSFTAVITVGSTGTALVNGTSYPVTVRAQNSEGNSVASAPVSATPATVPAAPGTPAAVRANGAATLTFTAPSTDGGSAITGYEFAVNGGTTWTALTNVSTTAGTVSGTATGLTNGMPYTITVRAANVQGTSGPSAASTAVTPATSPSAPTGLTAALGSGQAVITFTVPGNGGDAITGWQVDSGNGFVNATPNANSGSTEGSKASITVSGLTNGVATPIVVRAVNSVGNGASSSSITVTPVGPPVDAPTIATANPANSSAVLTITAPVRNGGAAISGYQYHLDTDAAGTWHALTTTTVGSTTTGTITGLTNGTASTILIRALNENGAGPVSTPSVVTPAPTAPAAPTGVTVVRTAAVDGDPTHGTAAVTFTPPADNGAAISGYQYRLNGGTWTTLQLDAGGTDTLTGRITGLDDSMSYTIEIVAINTAGTSPASASVTAGVPAPAGSYASIAPARIMDTRIGLGAPQDRLRKGVPAMLTVAGRGGVPLTGVASVMVNLTVTNATSTGNITANAAGATRPGTSNLNFVAGQTVANMAVVPVLDGKIDLTSITVSADGRVDLIADVVGYTLEGQPTAAGTLQTLTPARLLDTRNGTGGATRVPAGGVVTLMVKGQGGVPNAAIGAAALNVTVTNPAVAGNLTVFPGDAAMPMSSHLNFAKGQTAANLTVTKVGADGTVKIANNSRGAVDIIADVSAYTVTGTTSAKGTFEALTPSRILDTRTGAGTTAPGTVPAGGTLVLQVGGKGGVPGTGVDAVALNVTAVDARLGGNLLVASGTGALPATSNVNFAARQTIPGLVVVKVDEQGKVRIVNQSRGEIHVIADVAGYVHS